LPHKPHQLSTAHVPSFFIPEDGNRAVTGYSDSIKVWDLATGKQVGPHFDGYDQCQRVSGHGLYACSTDGRYACTALGRMERKNPRLRIWDLTSGKLLREINLPKDDYSYISDASFAENGRVLLAVADAGWLYAWEVANGKHLWSLCILKGSKTRAVRPLGSASFSPDGRWLLSDGEGTTMRLWDTAKRRPIWSSDMKGTE
jgi:WD40 repeat protein